MTSIRFPILVSIFAMIAGCDKDAPPLEGSSNPAPASSAATFPDLVQLPAGTDSARVVQSAPRRPDSISVDSGGTTMAWKAEGVRVLVKNGKLVKAEILPDHTN